MSRPGYCDCDEPIIDYDHSAGCGRCGLPVDFTPPSDIVIRIQLGNEAMQELPDVADAIRREALVLLSAGYTDGPIHDRNGNTVGSLSLEARP